MINHLAYVVWNVNPTAFQMFGLEIRWYGVFFALSFAFGYTLLSYMLKREKAPDSLVDTLLWYVVFSVIIGARLGHCLFYEPSYFLTKEHFIEILYVRDGGLASHGAAIAILFSLYFVARKYKLSYWYILDRVVLIIASAGFFIRLGNLMNSEIYGSPTTQFWGFLFVQNHEVMPKHPTQIYEALSYLILFFFILYYLWKKKGNTKEGLTFGWFLVGCFGMRFLIEFIKENQELWEDQYWLNMGQILSIPLILIGITILILAYKGLLPHRKGITKKTL